MPDGDRGNDFVLFTMIMVVGVPQIQV
jgi:hypothetical protein